ncbi:MAG TPA: PAS domain S-box protein, partial [Nitrospira sp.]|nr:PAS domain S-box protein [Nitrospira sp.]
MRTLEFQRIAGDWNHPFRGRREGMMEQLSEHRISRRGRAVLERLVDSSSDALLVIAGDGRIQEVNCQAERLLGYFRHELIGSKADRHISNLSREIESHADMAIASDAQLRSMEPGLVLDGRHRDGSEFPVDVLLCSVRADGEPFVLVFLQDL